MFERYTERARRIIFFARYEASTFGSPTIESEHLLLGLLREDRPFSMRVFRSQSALDSVRHQVEAHAPKRERVSTSVDLPLSRETKSILALASEEAENLKHRHIDTAHLMLGILREGRSLAAMMLTERQVSVQAVRAFAAEKQSPAQRTVPARVPKMPPSLLDALLQRQDQGDITIVTHATLANVALDIALYEGAAILTDGDPIAPPPPYLPVTPAQQASALRRRIKRVLHMLENAIANHNFTLAREHSEEERELRNQLSQIDPTPEPVPFLCILLLGTESLVQLRASLQILHDAGVLHVWLVDTHHQHLYTATPAEGLQESSAGALRIERPPVTLQRQHFFPETIC